MESSGCGLENNPLQLSWASGEPPHGQPLKVSKVTSSTAAAVGADAEPHESLEREGDYESITLMRLRQAQERKRLNEQLDDND